MQSREKTKNLFLRERGRLVLKYLLSNAETHDLKEQEREIKDIKPKFTTPNVGGSDMIVLVDD